LSAPEKKLRENGDSWRTLVESGNKAYGQKRYAEAETDFKMALNIAEEDAQRSSAERETLVRLTKSLNNMAALYHCQGKYSLAEGLYKKSLDLKKQLWGEDDLEVALNIYNLAILYSAKRQYVEAEDLFRRALAMREAKLGSNHADLIEHLKSYALLLRRLSRSGEADQMEQRISQIAQANKPEKPL
jgi:tetratricopeptide (TPR) repeat protein